MLPSLKSRGLAGGLAIVGCILLLALYGQQGIQHNLKLNHHSSVQINQLNRLIENLKKPVKGLEVSIYQFLLSLEPGDQLTVYYFINQTASELEALLQSGLLNIHHQLREHAQQVDELHESIADKASLLLEFTREQRFPSMQLTLQRMNPAMETFSANIQILESYLLERDNSGEMERTRSLVRRLKFIWGQSQSNVRLMLPGRTGLYGNPQLALEMLENNSRQYNSEMNELLRALTRFAGRDSMDIELVAALAQLSTAMQTRLQTLDLLKQALARNDWRRDKYIMNTEVKPLFDQLNGRILQLEQLSDQLTRQNLERTEYQSEQLSLFLWVFAFIVMALIMSTSLVFEHWIRIPLETVARSMRSQASQSSVDPLQRTGAYEIDTLIDAYETMQAQIALRQQRITTILQNAGEGIVLINQAHRIDVFNQAAELLFNRSQQDVHNLYFLDLFDLSDDNMRTSVLENLADPDIANHCYLWHGVRPDGSRVPIDLTVSNIELENQPYNILVMRDASDRIDNENALNQARIQAETMQQMLAEQVEQLYESLSQLNQTQKQLVESEKMAALARLVAGVAHEINTPIGIGVTASSHLKEELKEFSKQLQQGNGNYAQIEERIDDITSAATIIENNLQRAATQIRGFKQVAVDQSSEKVRSFNLRQYLDEIVLNLHPQFKKTHHRIHIDVADFILLNSVPGALAQIITNLLINTLTHAYDGDVEGNIRISATTEGEQLQLVYEDDGKGMSEQTCGKVFEPFFTTRRGAGGSGLGMHISYNLATTTLHGSIECDKSVTRGARFILRIPLSIAA